MLRKASLAALMGILLVAFPAAAAGTKDSASITTAGPIELVGRMHGEATEAVLYWTESGGAIEWSVDHALIEIKRVSMPVVESPLGDISYQPEFTTQRIELHNGTVTISPVDGASIRLHGAGLLSYGTAAASNIVLDHHLETDGFNYRAPSDTRPFYYNAEGIFDAFVVDDASDVRAGFAGDAEAFIIGAKVRASDSSGTAEAMLSEASSKDPLVPAARRDEYSFMTITARGLRFQDQKPSSLELAHTTPEVDGKLTFESMEGQAEAGQSRFPNLLGENSIVGVIRIENAEETPTGTRYEIGGRFDGIELRGEFIEAKRHQGTAAVGIFAAIAIVLAGARASLASFAGAFYTRIARSSVLENPARSRALDHLQRHPGTHLRDLQRAMGWGWGTLHYHLAVLCKANLVVIERAGKHALAYPRVKFPPTPEIRLALRGQAANVYAALNESGATQTELVERLGLSRQLVAHHLTLLERDGLIVVEGSRPKMYRRGGMQREDAAGAHLASAQL